MNFFNGLKTYSELVKIAHTLFALPFALAALCLAYIKGYEITLGKLAAVAIAFAAARSAAMGFNRIADIDVDALNPRTKNRPSINGKISKKQMIFFTGLSALIFVASAFSINFACFWLSFPALAVLFGYSYCKRFTFASHYMLGIALALAPIGAWIAAADSLYLPILALGAALLFNISSFDIIYSLQDLDFDKAHSLHSIPARFGRRNALLLAAFGFLAAFALFIFTGLLFSLNAFYFACSCAIGALYLAGIITTLNCGLKRVNLVFFYINVCVSALQFFGIASNLF